MQTFAEFIAEVAYAAFSIFNGVFQAVREFVDQHQPEYFFCGHIHECAGVEVTLGPTKAVNVGKKGYLLEIE